MNLCAHITVQIRKYKSSWCNFHSAAFASSFVPSISLSQERELWGPGGEGRKLPPPMEYPGEGLLRKGVVPLAREIWHGFINMVFMCGETWEKLVWKRGLMGLSCSLLSCSQTYGLHTGPLMQICLCSPLEMYTQRGLCNLELTKPT